MLPLVCISILNWNTPQRTLACLASLQQLDYANYQVVVVDNASADASAQQLRAAYPQHAFIQASSNTGFAGGHRLALDYARQQQAALLWLLNSDAVVSADTLSKLVAAYLSGPKRALYGGTPIHDEQGRIVIDFPSRYFHLPYRQTLFGRDMPMAYDPRSKARHVAAVPGSTMLIPLAVVDEVGWMDERYFMYGEETDYCLRLGQMGIPSFLVQTSRIHHEGGGSAHDWRGVRRVIGYYRARNEIAFAARWSGRMLAYGIATKKLLRGLSVARQDPEAARFIWQGVWDGLRGRMGKTHAPEAYLR